jgi:hypothetical protein
MATGIKRSHDNNVPLSLLISTEYITQKHGPKDP